MSTRLYFLGLTRLAFLDAMVLILMSFQLIAPPLIVVNIIVVPSIFALQIYYISLRSWLFSGLALLLIISAGFGVDSGAWTTVFLMLGLVYGVCNKFHIPVFFNVLSAVVVFTISIVGVFELLRRFARISWEEIIQLANTIPVQLITPLLYTIIVGLAIWGLISCIVGNRFFRRVIKQLEGEIL